MTIEEREEGHRPFTSEQKLLEKLEAWLDSRPLQPTILDVIATRDGELLAAYVLKAFRVATAQAVVDHLEHHAKSTFSNAPEGGSAAYRVFTAIADAWHLNKHERLALLGLDGAGGAEVISSTPTRKLGPDILERLAILLDIFEAINTLLPIEERADVWMRKPNRAPLFKGHSAIALMLDHGVEGLRMLRSYLQSQTS